MKTALYIILALIGFVLISFFILGKKSQSGSAPGLVGGQLAACSSKPNCVSSEAGTPDKKSVAPIEGTSLDRVAAAITAAGGQITTSTSDYISATFTSSIFKFVDDFEARLDGDKIHIRSASRVGYSDRGVNRARVEAIRAVVSQ